MDQQTAAACWLAAKHPDEQEREYLRTVVEGMLAIARKYNAGIDWENSDVYNRVVYFTVEPDDIEAFSSDLADYFGEDLDA